MTKLLVAIAGLVAGGAIVTGTAVAYGTTSVSASTGMTKITIQHVQKGCHVLSNGSRQAASMTLNLKSGASLQLRSMDIDPQGLVQLSGPKLNIKGHMMMGQQQTITFKQPGVYRLKNKVIEMGTMMNVKTIGPDNTLRLTVSVR